MQHLVDAVRGSVRDQNWYAALTLALALPDIAGKLDGRKGGSQARFVSWFDDYLLASYREDLPIIGREPNQYLHVFLSGKDCYALRCAYLHEGDFDIMGQACRDALERFVFVTTRPGETAHRHQSGQVLQLQVDRFCEEACAAVEEWLRRRGSDPDVAAALAGMPAIFLAA